MKPKRLQRKRTKEFKIKNLCKNPNGYVFVGRPSKWGNPYIVGQKYRKNITDKFDTWDLEKVLFEYRKYIETRLYLKPDCLNELKGKDLVCWCSLEKKCHADILLELANGT